MLPPVQPVRHRLPAQAALDPYLAPPSPSPMEQGRVLPEFPEVTHRPAASVARAAQAETTKQVAPSKSRPGFNWLNLMSEPQGAALLRKDLQPLSSLESVGTPLGRGSPAPEQAAPASIGEHAESGRDQEQHHNKQLRTSVEPNLPPKKRKAAREMTPPVASGHHLWARQKSPKPAPTASVGHHDDHWDAVVPKRHRHHRALPNDSSSSSSAAAFEHRPVIPASRLHDAHTEAHSVPQKELSDPLCMLLDAAEELSHNEVCPAPQCRHLTMSCWVL